MRLFAVVAAVALLTIAQANPPRQVQASKYALRSFSSDSVGAVVNVTSKCWKRNGRSAASVTVRAVGVHMSPSFAANLAGEDGWAGVHLAVTPTRTNLLTNAGIGVQQGGGTPAPRVCCANPAHGGVHPGMLCETARSTTWEDAAKGKHPWQSSTRECRNKAVCGTVGQKLFFVSADVNRLEKEAETNPMSPLGTKVMVECPQGAREAHLQVWMVLCTPGTSELIAVRDTTLSAHVFDSELPPAEVDMTWSAVPTLVPTPTPTPKPPRATPKPKPVTPKPQPTPKPAVARKVAAKAVEEAVATPAAQAEPVPAVADVPAEPKRVKLVPKKPKKKETSDVMETVEERVARATGKEKPTPSPAPKKPLTVDERIQRALERSRRSGR